MKATHHLLMLMLSLCTVLGFAQDKQISPTLAAIFDAERDFSKISETEGLMKAYIRHLSDEARLHRDGTHPLSTHDEIISYVSKNSSNRAWDAMFAEVSQSEDLGYTYGSYESKAANSQDASTEKGFYARVWKKDQANKWKVVADIVKPQPPEEK